MLYVRRCVGVVQLKLEHPSWGAPKTRAKLRRRHDNLQTPAISTVHAVLEHLTLKKEATKPAAQDLLQQQERFDDFIACYNHGHPHQALDMLYPAELYAQPPRHVG